MTLMPIRVDLSTPGRATVEVDGVDLSAQLVGFRMDVVANEMPRLALYAQPEGELTGVADVVRMEPGEVDESAVVLRWLGQLDHAALERAVLDEWEGSHGETALRVLKRWAEGGT